MEKDKKISACQPKILDYNHRNKFEGVAKKWSFIDKFGYPFCRGRIFNHLEEDLGQYNDSKEVFASTGACLFVRTTHFFEIGGLDEDFLHIRKKSIFVGDLKIKDIKLFVEPKSLVYHVGGGTLNVGSPFKTHLNFRNNLYMLFKNLPLSSLFIMLIRLVFRWIDLLPS